MEVLALFQAPDAEVGTNVMEKTFVFTPRPWLSLYGNLIRPTHRPEETGDLTGTQKALPNEIMLLVLAKLHPYVLGKVACTCRNWRIIADNPKLWEPAVRSALKASRFDAGVTIESLFKQQYRYSWKRMFCSHPHVRFDGVYVARNTYIRQGVADLTYSKTVHLVCYFRYMRFFEDGTVLYRTSPQVVSKVAKAMTAANAKKKQMDNLFPGRYLTQDASVKAIIVYPNSRSTEIRSQLSIRSTHDGAFNRMDLNSLVTYDQETGNSTSLTPTPPSDFDEDPQDENALRRDHRRGLAPFIFVPWESVASSPLNLPVTEMDYFI